MSCNWIFIADDDSEDQEMLIEVIRQLDSTIQVRTAMDGQEALSQITGLGDKEFPDLVILDYKMPYMNAGEVLEALAGEERYGRIPKIVWSTSNRPEDVNRCLKAGALHYFVKPSRLSELRNVVRQMLDFCKLSDYSGK